MYNSPIQIAQKIAEQVAECTDNSIVAAVLKVGVHVDRDELIRALQYDRDQYDKGWNDAVAWTKDKWIGQWIPVTERLPVCGERVLVLVDSCAVFEAYLGISHKWVRYGSFWIDGVTHWMPLPEPPEGESK